MLTNRSRQFVSPLLASLIGVLYSVWTAQAQDVTPVPLPDPGISGFEFPTAEDVIIDWTEKNNQKAINWHAWGLWTALTMETDQIYNGQKLLVFETWPTPSDIINGKSTAPRSPTPLRQFSHDNASASASPTILGFVKYDPTATAHIKQNQLFSQSALNGMLADGKTKIPDFPVTAISLKPVFRTIAKGNLVDERYYQLPAWPGPGTPEPGYARPFDWPEWGQCVWVDIKNEGKGDGSVDRLCAPDGSSRTPQTTYGIDQFINFQMSADEAKTFNTNNNQLWQKQVAAANKAGQSFPLPPSQLADGDYAILVAMHVTSREITRWTWQTFWWTPKPDAPNFPSSEAIANDRPPQLKGAPRMYAHAPAYSMKFPPQPDTGGKNTGSSVYSYNPWLEAGFSPSVLAQSTPGTYEGQPVTNDVGIMTNCMSCHGNANYNPRSLPNAPSYTGNRYIDLENSQFRGTLKVDFLWSIPNNAK